MCPYALTVVIPLKGSRSVAVGRFGWREHAILGRRPKELHASMQSPTFKSSLFDLRDVSKKLYPAKGVHQGGVACA